jgi:hypothetical protein
MGRHLRTAFAVLLAAAGLVAGGPMSAASALTSGPESFTGFLIVTGVSGERVELASNIRARGVFDGSGKIVERPPQPGDPENMDRDDLVFPQGTLHLFSFVQDFQIVSFDPNSCRLAVTVTRQHAVRRRHRHLRRGKRHRHRPGRRQRPGAAQPGRQLLAGAATRARARRGLRLGHTHVLTGRSPPTS